MRQHTFGDLLKIWRIRRGATQQQLADLSTISVRAIRDLEFGRVAHPRQDTVRLIANALALTGRGRADFEAAATGRRPRLHCDWDQASPPAALDAVVGRDFETTAILESMSADDQRLVAVVGLAGVGKSRVALTVAAALHETERFGVVWVTPAGGGGHRDELSQVAESALTEPSTMADLDELSATITDRAALLVLDGYPAGQIHAESVATLLHECRNLRILITTRTAPVIAGSSMLSLTPLASPSEHDDLATVRSAPAVRLLRRHIRLSRPDFEVTAANASAVAGLCRALDGIPAALVALASWFLFYEPSMLLDHVRTDPFAVLEHAFLAGEMPGVHDHLDRLINTLDDNARVVLHVLAQQEQPWNMAEAAARTGLATPTCTGAVSALTISGLVRPLRGSRFQVLELVRFRLGVRPAPIRGSTRHVSAPRPGEAARSAVAGRRFTVESAGLLPG